MDRLEQRYVLENQMVGGKLNQKEQEYTPLFLFLINVFGSG